MRKRFFCLLMAFVLLTGIAGATGYDDKEHLAVDFADMTFAPFDETALTEALRRLETLCGPDCSKDDRGEAQALYDTILQEFDELNTLYILADIHYAASGASQEWADANAEVLEQTIYWQDRIYTAFRSLADSPCRGVLEDALGKQRTNALRDYTELSEEETRLLQQETQLVQTYDQLATSGVEVTVDGQVWTDETLNAAEDLDVDQYFKISDRLDEALNDAVGETFRQLVQVRTAIAEEEGYDSYIDYAYDAYNRDYTPKNIRRLRESVKKYFVPLYNLYCDAYDPDALNRFRQSLGTEGNTLMNALQPGISAIHPDLAVSYDFMMQHNLYDTDLRPGKLNGAFTAPLPAYGTAYIFNAPYGTYQDCSDMVHEFGHFNKIFYDPTPALWAVQNMDTAEIHSQALQLLYASSSDLFGESREDFLCAILTEIIDSVLQGFLYDEFLAEVYANPDQSLEEINRLFLDVSQSYGYHYPEDQTESWFWVRVHHNFQSPFYYISYAVSALSAMDLWLRSLNDWDGAVQSYMDLTALSLEVPFREALEESELADVLDSAVLREIAEAAETFFLEEDVDYNPSVSPMHAAVKRAAYLLGVALGFIILFSPLILLAAVVLLVRRRRRARKTARNLPEGNWKP